VNFAHESEREFAAILDYYQIRWEYEPRTFPLRWDADGKPIESFTPDFYLVDQGLFIELTTLKQRLVTKKNRKLRLLRALYPDVRIKLFYSRDLKSLMVKYGLQKGPRVGVQEPDVARGDRANEQVGESGNGRVGDGVTREYSGVSPPAVRDAARSSRHEEVGGKASSSSVRRSTRSPRRAAGGGGGGEGQ
jgi:hypothetical protein